MARTKRKVKPLPTIWEASDEQWTIIQPILDKHDPPAPTGRWAAWWLGRMCMTRSPGASVGR